MNSPTPDTGQQGAGHVWLFRCLPLIAVRHFEVITMVAEIQTLIDGGLARKTELVEMAGGLYRLPQVASLLNVSEEAIED
jgi:hypothetical protein